MPPRAPRPRRPPPLPANTVVWRGRASGERTSDELAAHERAPGAAKCRVEGGRRSRASVRAAVGGGGGGGTRERTSDAGGAAVGCSGASGW